jgi:hypothetical protein
VRRRQCGGSEIPFIVAAGSSREFLNQTTRESKVSSVLSNPKFAQEIAAE